MVALQCFDENIHKVFARNGHDLHMWMIFLDSIANGMHQVCFSETRWTVDKERIVVAAWKFSYILSSSKRNAVGVARYIVIKTVRRIEIR